IIIGAVSSIFMTGMLVAVSQAYGAGDREAIERISGETLLFSLALSLLIIVTQPLWLELYVGILSGGQKTAGMIAETYLAFRLLSVPALMISSVLSTLYRALEKPWPPNYSAILSSSIAVVLIPSIALGFIETPFKGIEGLGLASALSQYAGLIVYLFFRPPTRIRIAPPSRYLLKVLAVGVPASLERFVSSVGHNIYINAVARSGLNALAAHNIGISIENLIINPVFAISIAASARVGYHVGSNSRRDLDHLMRESLEIGISWMSIATVILLALSLALEFLLEIDPEILSLVRTYLILAAISEIGFGGSLALYGVIRGMGSTWIPLVISSFTVLILRAFLAQILQLFFGIYGVWSTQITDMYGRFLISYAVYRKFRNRLIMKVI
ncbi:MAG: MATE family efflux transporter, partial [Sulfolobales archaeon]